MKRALALCLISAVVGGIAARWWWPHEGHSVFSGLSTETMAQEPAPVGTALATPAAAAVAAAQRVDADLAALTPEEQVNVAVYEKVNRSVVNINTRGVHGERFLLFEQPAEGAGSGSVLDRQGRILTNFHVVDDAREIQVTLFDGRNYPARVVGQDAASDIAVIQIDAPPQSLFPVELGDSTRLHVGQRVFAIGNPFGLERTLTVGIVSSLNRSIDSPGHRKMSSIIQTDAAINPGNSGGPLLNSHGQLIGMNTAIASNTGQSAGVGFAIPASAIRRIVPQLLEKGRVVRPEIGITRVMETETGIVIATMAKGGPAEQAGLRGFTLKKERRRQGPFMVEQTVVDRTAADRIVAIDGQPVKGAAAFLDRIESHRPGEEVTLSIVRDGQRQDARVRLGSGE